MPAILSKNCVLAGEVECYCLVCCELLPAEHDVLAHIQLASHKHNLSSHAYLHKFQRDCIRKVAGVYFCEFCNMTFPTAAKVSLHITEHSHLENKEGRMLTRGDNCVVFNENIIITENAWNGLVDDTCVLCNAEFEDESVHKSEQNHILNLIRSRVTFGDHNNIYRQVEGFYQCLTCNKVVTKNAINDHLDTMQHKGFLTVSADPEDYNSNEKSEKKNPNDEIEGKEDPNYSNENDSSYDVQNNGDDGKSLYTRPVMKKTPAKPACTKSIPPEVASFAKQHGMSIIKNKHKVYCNKCSIEVDATLYGVKEHVAGRKHTEKLTKNSGVTKETPAKPTKMLLKKFINDLDFIDIEMNTASETSFEVGFVLVNNSFLIASHCFFGFSVCNDIITCNFCGVDLTPLNLEMHLDSSQHFNTFENSFIITSLPREFIRQLKPDLYDCVYCGHVERDWKDMLVHLDTDKHKAVKDDLEDVLIKYKTNLINRHIQSMMSLNLTAMMNSRRQFN